jgi:hypothetical protein
MRSVRIAATLGNARVPERQSLDRVADGRGASFVIGAIPACCIWQRRWRALVAIFLGANWPPGPIGADRSRWSAAGGPRYPTFSKRSGASATAQHIQA